MAKRKDFLTMVREKKERGEIPDYESRLKKTASRLEGHTSEEQENIQAEEQDTLQNVEQRSEPENSNEQEQSPGSDTSTEQSNRTVQPDSPIGQSNRTTQQDSPPEQATQPGRPLGQSNQTPQQDIPTGHPDVDKDQEPQNLLSQKAVSIKSKNHKLLYDFLTKHPDIVTNYENLHALTGIPKGTIRNALRSFESKGLIFKGIYRENNHKMQGIRIIVKHPNWTPQSDTPTGQSTWTVQSHSQIDREISLSKSSGGGSAEGGGFDPVNQSGEDTADAKLLSLSDADIGFHWPNLANYGFGARQIKQIVTQLHKANKTREHVFRGLDYIEFEIEHDQLIDKEGNKVGKVCDWAYRSLAANGYYRQPEGYISPEEQADRDAAKEAKQRRQAKYDRAVAEFEEWRAEMTEEEKQEHLKGKKGPEQQWLWARFKKIYGYEGKI